MKTHIIFLQCLLVVLSFSSFAQLNDSNREYKTIRDAFANRDKVEWLSLTNQGLKSLPDSLFELTNLKYLDLAHNQIEFIPDQIKRLSKLKYLVLSRNQLKVLPDAFSELIQLQTLYLDHNPQIDLDKSLIVLGMLPLLKTLSLAGDNITVLPMSLSGIQNVESLDLSENDFESLPAGTPKLKQLTTLYINDDVHFDLERNITVLSKLSSLKELHIENDSIRILPSNISELKSVEYLFLIGNNINSLPNEINRMKNLKLLDMTGNPIPPPLLYDEHLRPKVIFRINKN